MYESNNYEDEIFEEYWSDEEDNQVGRLTMKATQNDLSDVVSLYKEKLIDKVKKDNFR